MLKDPSVKYRPFPQINIPDRTWPSKIIDKAPRWLSTDLRDGNQSLIDPMGAEKKNRFFDLLVKVGLKEIEVGFPSAGATEYDFIRGLIENERVPEDVVIQVLTQSRADLIKTSFESLEGCPRPSCICITPSRHCGVRWSSAWKSPRSARSQKTVPSCCATMPPCSPTPTGISNIRPRPSRRRNWISA
jgi:hypothetical protein